MTDAKSKNFENSLLGNKHIFREISELKREIEFQKKLLYECEKDNRLKMDDPFFQKFGKLRDDNKEKGNELKMETKNFRQLESALKKVCLVNVKLDARLETEEELGEFRRSKFFNIRLIVRKTKSRNYEIKKRKIFK